MDNNYILVFEIQIFSPIQSDAVPTHSNVVSAFRLQSIVGMPFGSKL